MTLRRWPLAFAALLFVGTLLYYYWSMAHTFAIPSIDGPYYFIQVNSILKTGSIAYADPPLTFYLFALFAAALQSTEAGVMVGSAVFAAATSVSVYFLVRYIFKSEIPAIAAALASAVAAEHISLASNLMKNSLGILFLVGLIYFLHRSLDPQKRMRWNVLGGIGFFLLTMMTHVLDQGVAILFIGGYFVFSLAIRERRLLLSYGSVLLASVVTTVAGFLLLPSYFGDFSKGVIFASDVLSTSTSGTTLGGGAPPGASVTNPLLYVFLGVGLLLTAYEWMRGNRGRFVLIASASVIGVLLALPVIPTDFAWRFELMEFLPVSIIVGYACASLNGKLLRILVLFLLVSPLAFLGFQNAGSLTPNITAQGYSDLKSMASLVSDHSVLVTQGTGNAYWPQYLLGLPVESNSTAWLEAGYNVYLLVGSQGQQGQVNTGRGAQAMPNQQGQQVPPGQNGLPFSDSPAARGPQAGGSQTVLDTSNLTVVYQGTVYSLYRLG